MKKIKLFPLILLYCIISVFLGFLIHGIKKALGITANSEYAGMVGGAVVGGGIVFFNVLINYLIKKGKLKFLINENQDK